MKPKIFISYRRTDHADFVGRIRDRLVKRVGEKNVFLDSISIPSATDWQNYIKQEIINCDALVVIIGPDWLKLLSEKKGEEDYVRFEIEFAQENNKLIIPVCIKETTLPSEDLLPESIRPMLAINAEGISSGRNFEADCDRLLRAIRKEIKRRRGVSIPYRIIFILIISSVIVIALLSKNLIFPDKEEIIARGLPGQPPVTKNSQWTPQIDTFDSIEMVLVPAGCFEMGSASEGVSDERPASKQCFDEPFWIDRFEVSNGNYGSPGHFNLGNHHPRETISWNDALEYCQKRDARLPTEAEWEYAARGPDNLIYPWGNEFRADSVVYKGNAEGQPENVGGKTEGASWVGALNMSGNVWEWTSSLFLPYPYDKDDENPSAAGMRTIRGGSFDNNESELRSSYRYGLDPETISQHGGFRCVRDYE